MDWDAQRLEITRLYESGTLESVVKFMREQHGFDATPKQYKDRIKKWGLNKHIQQEEMEAMIRKQRKRRLESNKRSAFRVRKRPVNPEKINRYIKEHHIQPISANKDWNMDGNVGSAATPGDISCYTPSDTGQLTPDAATSPRATSSNPHAIANPQSLSSFQGPHVGSYQFGDPVTTLPSSPSVAQITSRPHRQPLSSIPIATSPTTSFDACIELDESDTIFTPEVHHDMTRLSSLNLSNKGIVIVGNQKVHSLDQTLQPSALRQSKSNGATEAGFISRHKTLPLQICPEGSTEGKRFTSDEWREYQPKCPDPPDTGAKITADDWQEYRPFIEQLYVVENVKLNDVMQILETKFGFVATKKTYKTKINQWGFMKNYKAAEKEHFANLFKAHRDSGEGIPPVTLRNRAVKVSRVRRFCKQQKIHEEICDAIPDASAKTAMFTEFSSVHWAAATGATVSLDPERPFSTVSKDGRIELVLFQTKIYHQSRFASPVGSNKFSGATQLSANNAAGDNEALQYNIKWESKLVNGMRALVERKSAQAWRMLNETCGMFNRVLDQQSHGLFSLLFFAFSDYRWSLYPDLRTHVLRFFTKVSAVRLGCNHPVSIVLYHLQEEQIFADAVIPAFDVLMDVSGAILNPTDEEVWRIKDNYCSMLRRRQEYAAAESHGLRFQNQCEKIFGRLHWRTRSLLLELGDVHHFQGLLETAECEYQDILRRGREDLGDKFPDEFCIYALQHLALICENRGDLAQSEKYWRDMLTGAIEQLGMEDEKATHLAVLLEKSLKRQGVDPEVWLQESFGISCI